MKKTLLIICTLSMLSFSAFALKLDLPLSNLNGGFGSATYDPATKTITYTTAWSEGKGWWLGGVDYSLYSDVTVNFEATDATVKLVVQYGDDSNNTPDAYANAGATTIKVVLDPAKRNNVKQIYLQKGGAGTLVLKEAFLSGAATPSAVIDFENKEIGTTYATVAWGPTVMTASVTANPSGTGKSLHAVGTNWNSYPRFTVSLPDGKKLGDIQKIMFDIYFSDVTSDQNSWKKADYFFGPTGATFTPNAATGTTPDNIVKSDSKVTWLPKEITLPETLSAELKALSEFDFAFGINAEKTDYYLDNILFVSTSSGIVNQTSSSIYFHNNTLNLNNTGSVQVFDINGRLIVTRENVSAVDLSTISRGVYIAKAVVEGKTEILKFIR